MHLKTSDSFENTVEQLWRLRALAERLGARAAWVVGQIRLGASYTTMPPRILRDVDRNPTDLDAAAARPRPPGAVLVERCRSRHVPLAGATRAAPSCVPCEPA